VSEFIDKTMSDAYDSRIANVEEDRKALEERYGADKDAQAEKVRAEVKGFKPFSTPDSFALGDMEGMTLDQYLSALKGWSASSDGSPIAPRMMIGDDIIGKDELDKVITTLDQGRIRTGDQKIWTREHIDLNPENPRRYIEYCVSVSDGTPTPVQIVLRRDSYALNHNSDGKLVVDSGDFVGREILTPTPGKQSVLYTYSMEPYGEDGDLKVPVERYFDHTFSKDVIRTDSDLKSEGRDERLDKGYLLGLGDYFKTAKGVSGQRPYLQVVYDERTGTVGGYKMRDATGVVKTISEAVADSIKSREGWVKSFQNRKGNANADKYLSMRDSLVRYAPAMREMKRLRDLASIFSGTRISSMNFLTNDNSKGILSAEGANGSNLYDEKVMRVCRALLFGKSPLLDNFDEIMRLVRGHVGETGEQRKELLSLLGVQEEP
jgi:hypothetical protein